MKLMILDGNSVINRAFFGIRPLTTREGLYTNAIFGFLNILDRVRHDETPDALCVAFDLHGPTFRHLQYDGYKANRHGMPEELAMQMPVMKDVLRAMNIPVYECQGWEADDIIGTVSRICSESDWECVVLTGDRDSLQLVNSNVTVKLVRTAGGQTLYTNYTPEVFREEYQMDPIRMIDLKSLMGDSSDNIPGVAGVGPKTATDLLVKYGTLQGVYDNLTPQNMKGKLFEKLTNGKDSAYLSYDLATIRTNAPIDFKPEDNMIQEPKRKELYDLFIRLEFHKMVDKYGLRSAALEEAPQDVTISKTRIVSVRTLADAKDAVAEMQNEETVIVFSENMQEMIASCEKVSYYFCTEQLADQYREALSLVMVPQIRKIAHDVKPMMRRLLEMGVHIDGFVFDTAIAAYLLDATRGEYPLRQTAQAYLSNVPQQAEDAPLEEVLNLLASCIRAMAPILRDKLKEEQSDTLYREIEFPLCRVLAHMEADGVLVDRAALQRFGKMLAERISACEELIFSCAGENFNINSTKQLGVLLFEKLGLPPVKKTKSGYSTNAEVLETLRDKHPIIQAIMDYRMLTKLKSTYADGLETAIAEDGRIHTTFQNTVTATGRLSSTEPNLQNIPVRTELGSEIRKMFVPQTGWVLVDADYSQIELRVLAHIANDKHMQDAFKSGEDFHRVTASQVFNVPVEEVTPTLRRNAKAVNFGIVYGISEFSLAQDIGVSRYEAKEYIESYLNRFQGVRAYMQNIVQTARDTGYVRTMFGRKRVIPEIKSSNFNVRSGAERIALNTPIQGTAADIIKLAMIRVFEALERDALCARLILQVHDELIVECPAYEAQHVMDIVAQTMEHAVELALPLVAEAKMGESWYEAK